MADRRKDGTGALHVLPDNVISQIFSFFSYKDLITYSAVSATFYVFCNDDSVWQDVYLADTNSTFTFEGTWKNTTLKKHKKTDKELEFPKPLHFEGIYSMYLYTRWFRAHADVSTFGVDKGDVERKKASELSVEDFIANYDSVSRPVLFTGETDHWKAHTNWSRENLLKIWGDTDFKVSERGSRKFKMKLKDYMRYLDLQHDEDPLYIFDSGFGERAPGMLKDYEIPKYFPVDYFDVMGRYKPSYRWYVMGPPHSGAPWHTDPAGTSAWNALIYGKKRWLMYPPGGMPPGVLPRVSPSGEHIYVSPSSLLWLLEVYPFLQEDEKPIECVQNPGEVIFVPGGWWHMVLNLEESVAVTQNFANDCNFQAVCDDFFSDRREIYHYFKSKLVEIKPDYLRRFEEFEHITDEITADFDDLDFWTPYVLDVLKRNNLPAAEPSDVSVLADGTNPVFLVKDMVVKFYSKRYGGERNFLAESGMYKATQASPIASVCPKMLANGKIEVSQKITAKALDKHDSGPMSDGADSIPVPSESTNGKGEAENGKQNGHVENGKEGDKPNSASEKLDYPEASLNGKEKEVTVSGTWPYVVMEFITGTNLVTAREEEMKIDMQGLAKLIAKTSMVLHGLKVNELLGRESDGVDATDCTDGADDFLRFLAKRREKCLRAHWQWNTLPPSLIVQIDGYLPKKVNEIMCREHVFTIHADMTDENVIGAELEEQKKPKKKGRKPKKEGEETQEEEKGTWVPRYLLDFGDSRKGDIAYDLVSLFISAFECKKEDLKTFFENYQLPSGETLWTYYTNNRATMVKRLMCYTLLHECDALATVFRHHPEAFKSSSFEELATLVWEM